jgi:hypothetical protein
MGETIEKPKTNYNAYYNNKTINLTPNAVKV